MGGRGIGSQWGGESIEERRMMMDEGEEEKEGRGRDERVLRDRCEGKEKRGGEGNA